MRELAEKAKDMLRNKRGFVSVTTAIAVVIVIMALVAGIYSLAIFFNLLQPKVEQYNNTNITGLVSDFTGITNDVYTVLGAVLVIGAVFLIIEVIRRQA